MTQALIGAQLVWDGANHVDVPEAMGTCRADQLRGTVYEKVSELAGRVCYDSLGKGRSSVEFHEHIIGVRHLSVYEHATFTLEIGAAGSEWLPGGEFPMLDLLPAFLNRPGVFVRIAPPVTAPRADMRESCYMRGVRVTLNVRAAIEWARWTRLGRTPRCWYEDALDRLIQRQLEKVCPTVYAKQQASVFARSFVPSLSELFRGRMKIDAQLVEPRTRDEQWVVLFLKGSRGMSHEQVRHGDFTSISQRSTRYVDESQSAWVEHPLITAYLASGDAGYSPVADSSVVETAQEQYRRTVEALEAWLLGRGVDKVTARKQARGAARGYLGNALYTELIFGASVNQWRAMLEQRCSPAADAEIREMYCPVLRALQSSQYGREFTDLELAPSPDGIGQIVRERAKIPA